MPLVATLALVGCTDSGPNEATPLPRVTVQVTVTPSPEASSASPSESAAPDTAQAPFQSVVNLASVSIDGTVVTVGGFASGIAEDGGRCTYSLTSVASGVTVTRAAEGIANVDMTSCGSLDVPITDLSRGTWNVTLTYESEEGSGASLPLAVEVP